MSNGTNDKLNDTLDKIGATEAKKPGPAQSEKKSSDTGFYLVMLLIISGAAFYIYQDAAKRYGTGIAATETVQPPGIQTVPSSQLQPSEAQPYQSQSYAPQVNTRVNAQQGIQPAMEQHQTAAEQVNQAAIPAGQSVEQESSQLKQMMSNLIDKVKDFVTVGSNKSEVTTETVLAVQESAGQESADQQSVSISEHSTVTIAQPAVAYNSQQDVTKTPSQPQVEAAIETEGSLQQKVNKMVDKAKSLVHIKENKQATQVTQTQATMPQTHPATENPQAVVNLQTDNSANQPYAYDSRGYQENMPVSYGAADYSANHYPYNSYDSGYRGNNGAYGSYQARAPYPPSGNVYNSYQAEAQYQPAQYQPYQNQNYNPYYNQGYGNSYQANPQYQRGPGY